VTKYVRAFDITSICVDRDGSIRITCDPQGAVEAYWLPAAYAGALLKIARVMGDITGAAQQMRLKLTDHHTMVVRARAAIERLGTRLTAAKADGAMKFLNREYRRRRIEANERGESFMPYRAAEQRLRKALADVAAGKAAPGIVASVFEDRRSEPPAAPVARQTGEGRPMFAYRYQ
jgi:hypothetical protein